MGYEKSGEAPCVLEGLVSLDAVFKSGSRRLDRVFLDKKRAAERQREASYIRHACERAGASFELVDGEVIDSFASGRTHGGILAFAGERRYKTLEQLADKKGFLCLIEGIEDPYNFGFCVRSLYAAGADGLVLPPRNWMSASAVVARSSAGASELIDASQGDVLEAVSFLKSKGYRIVCASGEGKHDYSSPDAGLTVPLLLVVGGEKRGISKSLLEMADSTVKIDYGRDFDQSLPSVCAVSVLAFEVSRRRGAR